MGELAIETICNNITNDALKKADNILNDAKLKADIILKEAEKTAEEYGSRLMADAKAEFDAEKKRLISLEKMSANKKILFAKQEIIEKTLVLAKSHIDNLPDDKYKKLLLSLLSKSAMELESFEGVKVILPQRAKKLISEREIKKTIGEKKLLSVEYLNEITTCVTIISKNIELTNGIHEIIYEKRDILSDIIGNMLFKEE